MKKKTHLVTMRITFDKPCTKRHAAKEAANCIHGEFYPTAYEATDPEKFRVQSIRPTE